MGSWLSRGVVFIQPVNGVRHLTKPIQPAEIAELFDDIGAAASEDNDLAETVEDVLPENEEQPQT